MSTLSPANRQAALVSLLVLGALLFAALACGAPNFNDPLNASYQPGGPYWACKTATPIATEWITTSTAMPGATAVAGWSTAVPTETPYYRYGEFYAGQRATIGDVGVTLENAEGGDGYTVLVFQVDNNGGTKTTLQMSRIVFIASAAGDRVMIDPELQRQVAPEFLDKELEPIEPGESRIYRMVFPGGTPAKVGFQVNLSASAPPAVYFRTERQSPTQCPYGQADWPVPMHQNARLGSQRPNASIVGKTPLLDAPYRLTSPFGCSDWGSGSGGWCDPSNDYDADGIPDVYLHNGLDLATGEGTPIYTPLAGKVTFSGWSTAGYGNLLVIRAPVGGGNYVWMYFAHQVEPPLYAVNDIVGCGANIGFVGSTGNSTGNHLHWEVRRGALDNGPYGARKVDPDTSRSEWGFVCEADIPAYQACMEGGNGDGVTYC
jgi:hypothetical protein